MKTNVNNQIKLGIFVTITVVLFTLGVYFVGKKQQLFNRTFHAKTIFKDIGGLQVGNNVRFSGINVGIVKSISIINDTSVSIDMVIDEDVHKFIKKNSLASIGSEGLMGNKLLTISQGTSTEIIKDGDYIMAARTANMDDIIDNLKTTTQNVTNITTDLAVIVNQVRSGKGALGKFFMDTAFAKNIDQTVVNIKQGSGGFKKNMDAASKSIFLRGIIKKEEKKREKEK